MASALSLDKEETIIAPQRHKQPTEAESYVPETPLPRERNGRHQSVTSDGIKTKRKSDGFKTVASTPVASAHTGPDSNKKKSPQSSIEPAGNVQRSDSRAPLPDIIHVPESKAGMEEGVPLGSDDSVVIVGNEQVGAPAPAESDDQ